MYADLIKRKFPHDQELDLYVQPQLPAVQLGKVLAKDTRIAYRKEKRVLGTQPTVTREEMTGTYQSDLCGKITLREDNGKLLLEFEQSALMAAHLTHWHYDVWEIHWDHPQAFFSFGTLKINTDNNRNVIGFDFDVPNDDFFFEELKPYRVAD